MGQKLTRLGGSFSKNTPTLYTEMLLGVHVRISLKALIVTLIVSSRWKDHISALLR